MYSHLKLADPTIYDLVVAERQRQSQTLMMIPSENYASRAVEEAMSSSFGNKYAEGYPGRRYYQGNEQADSIEQLCIDRAKHLFHVPFANVQAHSGSPANLAVQVATLQPGDVYMGLSLASGGHLTHGARLTAGSKYYVSVQYDVDEQGYIDYDALLTLATKHKPKLIIAGTTAYPRHIDWKKFRHIADKTGALLQADIAHIAGLVVTGQYPDPAPYVDIITTTTHKTLRGPRGALIMVTERGMARDPDLGKKINSAIIPGIQGGPHLNSIAAIAVALGEAGTSRFRTYARSIVANATTLASELERHGMSLVTGGTDSHLLLADMRAYGIIGNTMAEGCEVSGIILNRNGVPHDTQPPFYPSGIRLGTPGLTTRSMGKREMKQIALWLTQIARGLSRSATTLGHSIDDQKKPEIRRTIIESTPELAKIAREVRALCRSYPIPAKY